jgi:hypothetical protein
LYYYRNRYLLPGVGAFASEDPVGFAAGQNLYGYGSQNPMSFNDPTGLLTWTPQNGWCLEPGPDGSQILYPCNKPPPQPPGGEVCPVDPPNSTPTPQPTPPMSEPPSTGSPAGGGDETAACMNEASKEFLQDFGLGEGEDYVIAKQKYRIIKQLWEPWSALSGSYDAGHYVGSLISCGLGL